MPERFKVVCIPCKAIYKCSDLTTCYFIFVYCNLYTMLLLGCVSDYPGYKVHFTPTHLPMSFMVHTPHIQHFELQLLLVWPQLSLGNQNHDLLKNPGRSRSWYFHCGEDFFSTILKIFMSNVWIVYSSSMQYARCTITLYFCYLPPLSQVWILFTNELCASSNVVLCSDRKFTSYASHEKNWH